MHRAQAEGRKPPVRGHLPRYTGGAERKGWEGKKGRIPLLWGQRGLLMVLWHEAVGNLMNLLGEVLLLGVSGFDPALRKQEYCCLWGIQKGGRI